MVSGRAGSGRYGSRPFVRQVSGDPVTRRRSGEAHGVCARLGDDVGVRLVDSGALGELAVGLGDRVSPTRLLVSAVGLRSRVPSSVFSRSGRGVALSRVSPEPVFPPESVLSPESVFSPDARGASGQIGRAHV